MCLPCFFLSSVVYGSTKHQTIPILWTRRTFSIDWCDFYLPASLNAMGWKSTQCALVSMFFSLFAEKSQGFYVVYC